MTCREPSCFSQRSVAGFTSARFSESLGIQAPARGCVCGGDCAACIWVAMTLADDSNKVRREVFTAPDYIRRAEPACGQTVRGRSIPELLQPPAPRRTRSRLRKDRK